MARPVGALPFARSRSSTEVALGRITVPAFLHRRKLSREMPASRVVVAEDDVLLREGIASLLIDAGFDVAGQAGDASALASLVREHVPDLVIVDIRMP